MRTRQAPDGRPNKVAGHAKQFRQLKAMIEEEPEKYVNCRKNLQMCKKASKMLNWRGKTQVCSHRVSDILLKETETQDGVLVPCIKQRERP